MIIFKNLSSAKPYALLKQYYDNAITSDQKIVEAIAISSYSKQNNFVDSRFVNLKFVDNEDFIFFTNYQSPKATQFENHDQISALLFWSSINVQIRMKALIKKTSKEYTDQYFKMRSEKKNALSISSNQSEKVDSYQNVVENYEKVLATEKLNQCPDHWGGYFFRPYYFEFWEGHTSRINKRMCYEQEGNKWVKFYLEP